MIDVHIHTNKSDGEYMPTDVIKIAKNNGVKVLSITDHDTFEAINEIKQNIDKLEVELIPGVELSAKDNNKEVHILGYYFDHTNQELKDFCNKSVEKRNKRNEEYIKQFNSLGVNISYQDILKNTTSRVISKLHFANILYKKGYTTYFREAFKKYFNKKVFKDIKADFPSVESAIKVIRQAGGIPVLAHPKILNLNCEVLENKIKEWVGYGLGGIECYYTGHTNSDVHKFLNIANKYNLAITGGTDYHGPIVSPVVKLGTGMKNNVCLHDYELIIKMKQKCKSY